MKRNYVGLANSFHDGAIAIVDSQGELRFAEATERPTQMKRSIGMAPDVIHHTGSVIREYCEPDAHIVTAYPWREIPSPERTDGAIQRVLTALERADLLPESLYTDFAALRFSHEIGPVIKRMAGHTLAYELARIRWPGRDTGTRRTYDHHLAHAAAACFTSPFSEAVCAIVDGHGDAHSCAFFSFRNGELKPIGPADTGNGSLGFFYTAVCIACGFLPFAGEEWKVMGLAGYGKADPELIELFQSLIQVDGLTLRSGMSAMTSVKLHALARERGPDKLASADVAYAGQHVFCQTLYQLLNNLHKLGVSTNLVFGGGCALNSAATGAIAHNTGFRRTHVFCAPGDDGNAVGAALLAYHEDHASRGHLPKVASPYLGSRMSRETLGRVKQYARGKITECGSRAPELAAELLAQGKILGWIQGRAEFGPRALGNRSILADPRRPTIKDEINSKIKFREPFRPLAPSILHAYGDEYFEDYQESPYMERAIKFRSGVRDKVPGAVHVDGTGRLQSVHETWNEPFHRLLMKFLSLTGIPLVLNTSFNVMGKPISHCVEDVLAVFYSTGLDAVFIEDLLIEK